MAAARDRLPVLLERIPADELQLLCETAVLNASRTQRIVGCTLALVQQEVASLSHDERAELCATACGASKSILFKCESICACYDPIPADAMNGVFLSENDVMPYVFRHLIRRDCAAARVCHAWATAWREKLAEDERERPPPAQKAPNRRRGFMI